MTCNAPVQQRMNSPTREVRLAGEMILSLPSEIFVQISGTHVPIKGMIKAAGPLPPNLDICPVVCFNCELL